MNILPPSFSFSGDRNKAITLRPFAIHAYNRMVREAARGGVPFANYFKTLPDGSVVHFKAQKNSVFNNWSGRIQIFSPQLEEEEELVIRDFKVYISRVLSNRDYGDVRKWRSDLSEDLGIIGQGGTRYHSTVREGSIYTINPATLEDDEPNIVISRDVAGGAWLVFPKHSYGVQDDYMLSSNDTYLAVWSYRYSSTSMLHLIPWENPSARIDVPINLPYDNLGFGPSICFSINNANQIMVGGWRHPDTFPGVDKFMFQLFSIDVEEMSYELMWEYINNGWHSPGWPSGFITEQYAVFSECNDVGAAAGGAFTIFDVESGAVLVNKQNLFHDPEIGDIYHFAVNGNDLYIVSTGTSPVPTRVYHYHLETIDELLVASYQSHIDQESTPVFTGVWTS